MSLIVVAGFMLIIGTFAVALDTGSMYLAKQRAQAAADLAAMKAVADLGNASVVANASVARNVSPGLLGATQIETGRYPPTGYTMQTVGALPVANRFQAGAADPNAVRVMVRTQAPSFFARVFYPDALAVEARAIAFNKPLTQLAARSGLVAIDSGKSAALNSVFSSLLGTSVNLTVANHQSLLGAEIRLLPFLDALASQVGVSAGDYDAILVSTPTMPEVINAAIAAVQGDPTLAGSSATVVAALNSLKGQVGSVPGFDLASILELDADDPKDGAAARINLLDLLRASAEGVNQQNGLRVQVSAPIVGGLVRMTVVSNQATKFSAIGGAGISVNTSQTRMLVEVLPTQTINVAGLIVVSIRLPILITLGEGSATATAVACSGPTPDLGTVNVDAQSGAAAVFVADIDPAALHQAPSPATSPARIVSATVLGQTLAVTGTANINVSGPVEQLAFTAPFDVSNSQRVELSQPLGSLLTSSLAGLSLGFSIPNLLGIPIIPPGVLGALVGGVLNGVAAPVDALLGNVLAGLGTDLGYLDVAASYMRCSNPTLAG